MVSESFKTYPSECLVGLSDHPLSDHPYITLSHAQAVTLGMRGVLEIPRQLEIRAFHSI